MIERETRYPLALCHRWRNVNVEFAEIVGTKIFPRTFLPRSVREAGQSGRNVPETLYFWSYVQEYGVAVTVDFEINH